MSNFFNSLKNLGRGNKKEKKKEDEKVEEEKKQEQEQKDDYRDTKTANGSGSEDENFKNLRDKIEEDKNKKEQTAKTEHTGTEKREDAEAPKNSEEKREEKVSETSKEKVEQTAKTEHIETETKSEAKNNENSEKMFEEIKALNEKMENLNNLFVKKIGSIEFEREVGNKLHKELQEYKNDFYFQLIKPTILGLIRVRDNFKAGVKNFSKKSREEQDRFLKSFIDGIDIILDENEIEIFETDLTDENNQKYNSRKQKVVRKVETQEKEKNGKICELVSEGYIRNEKVIESEKVKVYVYKEKKDEEPKGE